MTEDVQRGHPAGEIDEDSSLVAAAQQGDQAALGDLLEKHQRRIAAVCLRTTGRREAVEDLVQESLLKLIAGIGSFDGRARFTTWMTRVVMNVCLTHLRREKFRRHASLDAPGNFGAGGSGKGGSGGSGDNDGPSFAASIEGSEPAAAQCVETREQFSMLQEALGRLAPEQRTILLLRDAHGLDYAQIAEHLGVAGGTVKSRLFRARAALRSLLEPEDGVQASLDS